MQPSIINVDPQSLEILSWAVCKTTVASCIYKHGNGKWKILAVFIVHIPGGSQKNPAMKLNNVKI